MVLDETHCVPDLLQTLRLLIDGARRNGRRTARFRILGSESMDLVRQSDEGLTVQTDYDDIQALAPTEVGGGEGGFPTSFRTKHDKASLKRRKSFSHPYPRPGRAAGGAAYPGENAGAPMDDSGTRQGTLLNASRLAGGLSLTVLTVTKYAALVLELPGRADRWALDVKRAPPVKPGGGLYQFW